MLKICSDSITTSRAVVSLCTGRKRAAWSVARYTCIKRRIKCYGLVNFAAITTVLYINKQTQLAAWRKVLYNSLVTPKWNLILSAIIHTNAHTHIHIPSIPSRRARGTRSWWHLRRRVWYWDPGYCGCGRDRPQHSTGTTHCHHCSLGSHWGKKR